MNTKEQEFLDWSNYPTWITNLWSTYEYQDYQHWNDWIECLLEKTRNNQKTINLLAVELEESVVQNIPQGITDLYFDLLDCAISKINWKEIAEEMIEDYHENKMKI